MTKLLSFFVLIMLAQLSVHAQQLFSGADYIYKYKVSVGKTTATPTNITPGLTNAAAWLEIGEDNTNKGVILPRIADTSSILNPVKGLFVYQNSDNTLYYRNSTKWVKIADNGTITDYVRISDSTVYYYPLNSNPKGYITEEEDPIAGNKTVTLTQGTGIVVGGSGNQFIKNNPTFSIAADNLSPIWNANALQGQPVSVAGATFGQILGYNGGSWVPTTLSTVGTVTSVGLSLPTDVYNVSGSPVTTSGVLNGSFKIQLGNLFFASPNGISGTPSFRAFAYSDMPSSGVVSGTYGNGTSSAQVTVNSQGIVTNATTVPIVNYWTTTGSTIYNNNAGNVGINTSSPTAQLEVNGSTNLGGTLQVTGNTTFAANGTPAAGKMPIGTDGAGNWSWGLPNTELIATLDNIDVLSANTYTLIPAVTGKRIIVTYAVYEQRASTGSGSFTFTPTFGTNATDYDNVGTTGGSPATFNSLNAVGSYTSFLSPQVTQSIASLPVVLKIVPGSGTLTAAAIRVFVRYALIDL